MEQETYEKLLDNLLFDLESGDFVTIAFQGGEPILAGLSWFRKFVDCARKKLQNVTLNFSLQTNGIILDDEWCQFFKENNF